MAMPYDLCEGLTIEIFSRLPTKSLLRFRSVSKSFYDLIGSPGFIRLHTLRSPKSPKRFAIRHQEVGNQEHLEARNMYTIHSEAQVSSYAGIPPIKYPFGDFIRIVGSCNGIVCVTDSTTDLIHLWNPLTRRRVIVREFPFVHYGLAFGFFFDPIMDDYKILRIMGDATFVYTMKTRTLLRIPSVAPPMACVETSQCLFDGALHWAASRRTDRHDYRFILRFDLSSEVFSTIEFPEAYWGPNHVTIIKGCLAVICTNGYGADSRLWVRNSAAGSWSFAYKVNNHLMSSNGDLFFSRDSRGILVYNLETKVQSRVVGLRYSRILDMITFTESLELLDVGSSCDVIKGRKPSKRKRRSKSSKRSKRVKAMQI